MPEQLQFDGRVAVITGAGRGIGRAHALLLSARGAKVVVNDLGIASADGSGGPSQRPATEVAQEINQAGGEAAANFDDVSTPEGAQSLITQALDTFGRLDIVINNAGIVHDVPFAKMDFAEFERMLRPHAYGTFNVTKAAWQHLVDQKYGRVVHTTSGVALYGNPGSLHYGMAKGAIFGMTRTLAQEGAPFGVKVNAIAPIAYTRMVAGMEDEVLRQQMETLMPPERVSPMVAWLAHEKCQMSGEFFDVGAGRAARVFIGEARGYCNPNLTLEDIDEHIDDICREDDYLVFKDGPESASVTFEIAAAAAGE